MSQGSLLAGIEAVRQHRGWFLVLGIVMIVLGTLTLPMAPWMSVAYVWIWGISLLIGAGFYFASMFQVRSWDGILIYMLLGLLSLFVGMFCVMHPFQAEVELTLVLAILLVVGGSFRAVSAVFLQYPGAVWSIFGGVIAVFLGMAVWQRWPSTGLWFIGMVVSVDMIIQGASWVALSFALKSPLTGPPGASPSIPPTK